MSIIHGKKAKCSLFLGANTELVSHKISCHKAYKINIVETSEILFFD